MIHQRSRGTGVFNHCAQFGAYRDKVMTKHLFDSVVLFCLLAVFAPTLAAQKTTHEVGDFFNFLARAAVRRTESVNRVVYDPAYVRIPMPLGDVPANKGVCTDLVIRSYRVMGIDLQSRVNHDMRKSFDAYPKIWGLKSPDSNIDHRRVPNLEVFFKRAGASLPVTDNSSDYSPGDLVTWTLPGGRPHIGVVTDRRTITGRPLIAHNIGMGPALEDFLFQCPINGHFRYMPDLSPVEMSQRPGLSNFYRISDTLYRSAQPSEAGFGSLKRLGLNTIVSLRAFHDDRDRARGQDLNLVHIRVQAWDPEKEELLKFLRTCLDASSWPVLVHCKHGSDRTGSFVAAYRIVVQGWTHQDALNEMLQPRFGFHSVFKNLVPWVKNLPVQELRKELGL